MALPLPWVDRIFDKLTLVYGQAFLRRWQDIDLQSVKADWAHELEGLDAAPKMIAFALQNLPPEKPPTVLEFRNAARRMPAEVVPTLPLPRLEPEVVASHTQVLRAMKRPTFLGNRDWAHTLIRRHEAGERILPYSLKLAQAAIAPRGATA